MLKVTEKEARDALATLARLGVSDFIYSVRERITEQVPSGQSTWDHADVIAWGNASLIAERVRKEQEGTV